MTPADNSIKKLQLRIQQIKNTVLAAVLLSFQLTTFAQSDKPDSSYIKSFEKGNIAEIYSGIYNTTYNFRDKQNRENSFKLRVNSSAYVGADIIYKGLFILYAFNVPGTELNSKAKFRYRQINFRFGSRRLIFQPFFTSYNGMLIPQQHSRNFELFQGIRFLNAGLETFYYFNPTRFSPKAAYAFSEKQIRSYGSPYVSLTGMWNKIKWEDPSVNMIHDTQTYNLLASHPQWISVIAKAGYAYNCALNNWLIAPSVMAGAGLIRENAKDNITLRPVTKVQATLNGGYNGDNYYAYAGGTISNENSSLLVKNVQSTNWTINLTVGHRFRSFKKKQRAG
jgi:hypothetical protein